MTLLNFSKLWDGHPFPTDPCDKTLFENQCAIRMGIALAAAGADLSTFLGEKCYPGLAHSPRHILRAQELAEWLLTQTKIVGTALISTAVKAEDYRNKHGIVFIKDGWGATDHIDVWDGTKFQMKGGKPDYFALGKEVWFWALAD
jgi:hypothetical protein